MTCKLTRKAGVLPGTAPLIAVLTVLIAMAALAQVAGRSQRSTNSQALPALRTEAKTPLFQPAVTYDSGGGYTFPEAAVRVADLNGDGKPDMVATSQGSTLGVLLGNGDGTFQAVVTYSSGGDFTRSAAIGDVNGDGKPDIVVANKAALGVLLGNGDGTFQPALVSSSGGTGADSVAISDVNGDGRPDLVATNLGGPDGGHDVGVMLGNGDGTFQVAATYDFLDAGVFYPYGVAVADINQDGKPDVLVYNVGTDYHYHGHHVVAVLLGNGDGTFAPAVFYDAGKPGPNGGLIIGFVTVADVNGDGKPDVLVTNSDSGTVGVLLGNGDGTLKTVTTRKSGGSFPVSLAVADVNRDGKSDIIVANALSKPSVLLGNGDGTFVFAGNYNSAGSGSSSIAVADLNGDSRPDLLVANAYSSTIGVLLNNTGATKTQVTTSGSPSHEGQPVTLTATVTAAYGTIPDGEQVQFFDGTTEMGTGATASGLATFTTSSLTAKTHHIKATYAGDSIFKPSTGRVTQVVQP